MFLKKEDFKVIENRLKESANKFSACLHIEILNNDETMFSSNYGYKDIENKTPFDDEAKLSYNLADWNLASICLLQLYEKKLFKYNDKLSKFIPEYKQADKVTIKQMVKLTSAIIDYVAGDKMKKEAQKDGFALLSDVEKRKLECLIETEKISFEEVLEIINNHELEHKPGWDTNYTLTNNILLCELVKRISGEEYTKYVLKNVFDKAGVKYTLGYNTDCRMYGQTDFEFRFKLSVAKNHFDVVTMDIENTKKLFFAFKNCLFFSKSTWEMMKKASKDVGYGFWYYNETIYLDLGFESLGASFAYNEKSGVTRTVIGNYLGDEILEDGKWKWFNKEAAGLIRSVYIKPDNPKLEKFNRKNSSDFFELTITTAQEYFVPNVYKCLAYSYNDKRRQNYVLKDNGIGVGMVTLTIDKKNGEYWISFLMVDEMFQRKGYGKILVNKACEILKDNGAKILRIGVRLENIAAYKTYKACGFIEEVVYSSFARLRKDL